MLAVGEIDVFPRRDPAVLNDDDFNNGPQGWVQLISGAHPEGGPIMLDAEITAGNSRYSLFLQSGTNHMDGVDDAWGGCVAIRRLYRPDLAKKMYLEWVWAFGTEFEYDTPRTVFFGMDTCDAAAQRRFFQVRWLTATKQYQAYHNNIWTDLPGITYPHAFNEDKRNLNHTEVVFDLENNRYDGLRINGIGYGSLAPTPDAALHAFSPKVEELRTFEGGLNPMFGFYNSNINSTTHGWANLCRQRTVMVK